MRSRWRVRHHRSRNSLWLRPCCSSRPSPGEIRIRVTAAGVDPVGWKLRSGFTAYLAVTYPLDEITEVHREAERGHTQGKPVITL
ncbi:hypothetical protein [Streptomyces sp. NPDC051132]|uniref:hypothetical protein n=1 Tax=unclassified Streptomyces TaxID=2593676 RepID=UPI00343183D5